MYLYQQSKVEPEITQVPETPFSPEVPMTDADPPPEEAWVRILSPKPGEKLIVGKTYTIKWEYTEFGKKIVEGFKPEDIIGVKIEDPTSKGIVPIEGPLYIDLERGDGLTRPKPPLPPFYEDPDLKSYILKTFSNTELTRRLAFQGTSYYPTEFVWTVPHDIIPADDYLLNIWPFNYRQLVTFSRGENFSIVPAEALIKAKDLKPYQFVPKSVITIEGEVRKLCDEGEFDIAVTGSYELNQEHYAWCHGDWMSDEWMPFTAKIDLTKIQNCYIDVRFSARGGREDIKIPTQYILPLKIKENCE